MAFPNERPSDFGIVGTDKNSDLGVADDKPFRIITGKDGGFEASTGGKNEKILTGFPLTAPFKMEILEWAALYPVAIKGKIIDTFEAYFL